MGTLASQNSIYESCGIEMRTMQYVLIIYIHRQQKTAYSFPIHNMTIHRPNLSCSIELHNEILISFVPITTLYKNPSGMMFIHRKQKVTRHYLKEQGNMLIRSYILVCSSKLQSHQARSCGVTPAAAIACTSGQDQVFAILESA